jgi:hypothetical protein
MALENIDPDRYIKKTNFDCFIGITVAVVGIFLILPTYNKNEIWLFILNQIGIAFVVAGTMDFLLSSFIYRIKLSLVSNIAKLDNNCKTTINTMEKANAIASRMSKEAELLIEKEQIKADIADIKDSVEILNDSILEIKRILSTK